VIKLVKIGFIGSLNQQLAAAAAAVVVVVVV
jgi:hypothetical protein